MVEYEYLFEPLYHAFNKHNIGFDNLVNYKFNHTNVDDVSNISASIPIVCSIEDIATPRKIDVYVNYHTNYGTHESILLEYKEDGTYTGAIPPQPDASRVHYYFTYVDPISYHSVKINRDYMCFVGYTELHSNDFEDVNDNSWKAENESSTINGFRQMRPLF